MSRHLSSSHERLIFSEVASLQHRVITRDSLSESYYVPQKSAIYLKANESLCLFAMQQESQELVL